jgi:hypothetical protein
MLVKNRVKQLDYQDFVGCKSVRDLIIKHGLVKAKDGKFCSYHNDLVRSRASEVGYSFPNSKRISKPWLSDKQITDYDKIFTKGHQRIDGSTLKRCLLYYNILEYKCENCNIDEWQGKPITLQVEHKNGDSTDNRVDNLCLLCPNCHSLTETYCVGKKAFVF